MKKLLTQELVTRKNSGKGIPQFGLLPNPDKMFRISGRAYKIMRQLKDDPHVWSCIQSRKSGSLSLEYTFLNDDNKEMESIFANFDLQSLLSDILEAPLFGFQPIEIIWKYDGQYLVPEKAQAKPQEWFYYTNDNKLAYRNVGINESKILPHEKILNPRYESSYINPYGNALLSKCYWPVTFKSGGMRFWVNFTEKYGMPLLIGKYSRGASQEETQKLAEVLANMSEDTTIVTPSDIDISMYEAARSSSVELYKEMINHCNAEISKAILSQTLTTELSAGSYAAAQTHFRIRREVIASDIKLIENTINQLITYISKFNFKFDEYPRFKLILNESDNSNIVERDTKLASAGLKFTKDYWCKTYGFKPEDIEF